MITHPANKFFFLRNVYISHQFWLYNFNALTIQLALKSKTQLELSENSIPVSVLGNDADRQYCSSKRFNFFKWMSLNETAHYSAAYVLCYLNVAVFHCLP